jgi:hypothetical protein
VPDLAAAVAHFRTLGVEPVGDAEAHFLFTHPAGTAGLLLEWGDNVMPEFDPRFGAALAPLDVDPLVDVRRVAWFGALVPDPRAAAARLRQLCRLDVLVDREAPSPTEPSVVLGLPDTCFALFALPSDEPTATAAWANPMLRPRCNAVALRVGDLSATMATLAEHGVRVVRGDPESGEVLTEPADTGEVPIVWTDRDLPNDPRGPLVP